MARKKSQRLLEKEELFKNVASEVVEKEVSEYVEGNFLPFAWSVCLDRALCYTKDGLKPIQRRILYTAYVHNITDKSPKMKSAQFDGLVMKYSPHGGSYGSMVNMAAPEVEGQPRDMRVPLIRGKGGWGGIQAPASACLTSDMKIAILEEDELEEYGIH